MKKQYYLYFLSTRSGFILYLKKDKQFLDKIATIILSKNCYYIYINEPRLNFWINCNLFNFSMSFSDLLIIKYLNCKLKDSQNKYLLLNK